MSSFRSRLKLSGWTFAFSYAFILVATVWHKEPQPYFMLLAMAAITAIHLAEVALTAPYPHLDDILSNPDMSTIPFMRRVILYTLLGLHWTILMAVFSMSTSDFSLGAGVLAAGGLFVGAGNAIIREYQLRG